MLRDEINSFLEQIGLSALSEDQELFFKLNIGSKEGHTISCKYYEPSDELIWCYCLPIAPYEQERVIELLCGNTMYQQLALYGFYFSVYWKDDHLVLLSRQDSQADSNTIASRFSGLIELIKNKIAPNESAY